MKCIIWIWLFLFCFWSPSKGQTWTWEAINTNNPGDLLELEWLGGQSWACLGKNAWIGISTNNGTTWENIQSPGNLEFVSVERVRFPVLGIWKNLVVDVSGNVFQIPAGGSQLVADSLPYSMPQGNPLRKLINLNIANNNDLRFGMAGDSGLLRCYKFPWANPEFEFRLSTQKRLNDVFPFNTWNILVAGDSGKIWRSVGLADPFFAINTNLTRSNLKKITGTGNNKLWISGDSGTILHSPNGGQNWEKISIPTGENLNSILVVDSSLWVCGEKGTVFFQPNSDAPWIDYSMGSNFDLNDIKRIDNQIWVCGNGGLLARLNFVSGAVQNGSKQYWNWELEENELKIWGQNKENLKISILGADGRLVTSGNVKNESEGRFRLMSKGLFFIKIQDDNGRFQVAKGINN